MKYIKLLIICSLCLLLGGCQKECVHEYQEQITSAATCSQEGIKTFTCTLCEYSYTEAIPMIKHNYDSGEIRIEATCAEYGLQIFTCVNCGDESEGSIDKLPHTPGEPIIEKAPTCNADGEQSTVCKICNAIELSSIPKTEDHQFKNTIVRTPTCVDPGEGIEECTVCGFTQKCTYLLEEHTYQPGNIIKQPTCTEAGSREIVCAVCSHKSTESVAANGHSWGSAPCGSRRKCTVCSQFHSEPVAHTYTITEEKKPSEHFAGKRVQKCSNCGIEKTLYLGVNNTYDFDAIKAELVAYARSLGFQIADVYINTDQTPKRFSMDVFSMELMGRGPKYMLQRGKACIDQMYEDYAPSPAGIGVYSLFIDVYYTQSGALGTGYYGVAVYIYS